MKFGEGVIGFIVLREGGGYWGELAKAFCGGCGVCCAQGSGQASVFASKCASAVEKGR